MASRSITTRKRDLAITLQSIPKHPDPQVALEQYTIPANLAAGILFRACYEFGDIEDKIVMDLGTGTGRLALGASTLGAGYVVGVDVDRWALSVASENSKKLGLTTDWVLADIHTLRGSVDTVVMNPPFGTKRPHADRDFLETAFRLARVIYSIHKSSTREYLAGWFRERDAKASILMTTKMEVPHQFSFHRMRSRDIEVDVFRIEVKRDTVSALIYRAAV